MLNTKNYIKIITCILIILAGSSLFSQDNKGTTKEFPVPAGNTKQLFYLQRNENINTVVYELNEEKGILNPTAPIHVFWILYLKQAQHEELSSMEKKFAYGIKIKSCDKEQCFFTLVAYPKITLHLTKDSSQKFHVYITPVKKQMILQKTFIKVKEGGFKLDPVVEYVEFSGIEVASGKEITERITP